MKDVQLGVSDPNFVLSDSNMQLDDGSETFDEDPEQQEEKGCCDYCNPRLPECTCCKECCKELGGMIQECFYSCGLECFFNAVTGSRRRDVNDRPERDPDDSDQIVTDDEEETYIKVCAVYRECCEPAGMQLDDIRSCLYGYDYSETEEGRSCVCKFGGFQKSTEHYTVCFFTAVISLIDLCTDILLIVKWLSKPGTDDFFSGPVRHPTEAYIMIGIIGISNLMSFIISISWKTSEERDSDGRRREGAMKFELSSILHLFGLGTAVAAWKSRHDWKSLNPIKNLGVYKWTELLFENCPALMITLYVAARDQYVIEDADGDNIFTIESAVITWSLCSMSYAVANFLTNQVPMAKKPGYAGNIGQRGWCRTINNTFMTLSDMILRQGAIVLFIVLYDENLTYSLLWALALFGGLEIFLTILGGQYYRWWQTAFIFYMCFFQGSVRYLARSWRFANHYRTVWVFVFRYGFNLGIFLYIFIHPDHADNEMNDAWFYPVLCASILLPITFFLKPNVVTPFQAFPKLRRRSMLTNIALATLQTATTLFNQETAGSLTNADPPPSARV